MREEPLSTVTVVFLSIREFEHQIRRGVRVERSRVRVRFVLKVLDCSPVTSVIAAHIRKDQTFRERNALIFSKSRRSRFLFLPQGPADSRSCLRSAWSSIALDLSIGVSLRRRVRGRRQKEIGEHEKKPSLCALR